MIALIIFLLVLSFNLSAKWEKINGPDMKTYLRNVCSGSNFLVGSNRSPYFSFDDGNTWESKTNGLPSDFYEPTKIQVDNDIVYMYTQAIISAENFLYSTNKGETWNKVGKYQKYANSDIINDFKVKNGVIYTIHNRVGAVIKSSDFGVTWDTLPKFDDTNLPFSFIDINADSIVIADRGSSGIGGLKNRGVMVSIDGGIAWEKRGTGLDLSAVNCIKLYHNNIFVGKKDGFFYSTDFGESWNKSFSLAYGIEVKDIEVVNDTVYLATYNGLIKAINLKSEWEAIDQFQNQMVHQIHYYRNNLYISSSQKDYFNHFSFVFKNLNEIDTLDFRTEPTYKSICIDYPNIIFSSSNTSENQLYKLTSIESSEVYKLTNEQKELVQSLKEQLE